MSKFMARLNYKHRTMKKRTILLCTLLVIGLMPIQAWGQTSKDVTATEGKPKSTLRLGLSAYDLYSQELGLELNYERFITPRIGVKASVFSSLRLNKKDGAALHDNIGNYTFFTDYDPVANFSIAINYYFKKNSQEGHFLSFQVNNAFTLSDRTDYLLEVGNTLVSTKEKRVLQSDPLVGLYYGYRKNFKSGFFIEGRIGVFYDDTFLDGYSSTNGLNFDAQLTVGWVIPFRKKR